MKLHITVARIDATCSNMRSVQLHNFFAQEVGAKWPGELGTRPPGHVFDKDRALFDSRARDIL
jgi:hypothetical protein